MKQGFPRNNEDKRGLRKNGVGLRIPERKNI